jgi:uncharacterized 2Fe-2S/4Fe-4S cluster protein (DUF4445 family)
VYIFDGDGGEITAEELSVLSAAEIASGCRLACMCRVKGDLSLETGPQKQEGEILASGLNRAFILNPAVEKRPFTISRADLNRYSSVEKLLRQEGGFEYLAPDLISALPYEAGKYGAVVYRGHLIALDAEGFSPALYGLAADIGTTTVVMSLIDLRNGAELGTKSAINRQNSFGQDVLSRIAYAAENPGKGVYQLQKIIASLLETMKDELCAEYKAAPENVYEMAVGANNTMLHLLLGANTAGLGRLPFIPAFTEAKYTLWRNIFPQSSSPAMRLYCLPSVSAYIGADVVAGAFVADLTNKKGNNLFVDIGTNGEIILAREGKLISCSCAAGPALEGMNISCGMRAVSGAAEDARIKNGRIEFKVIGGGRAEGLFGSCVLAVVRELLGAGLIKPGGALRKREELEENSPYASWLCLMEGKKALKLGDSGLVFTQSDIRQVQLAKGAILSGIRALLRKSDLTMENIAAVYISGQFGAHLPAESLVGCGILPPDAGNKIEYLGNTSKTGALAALLDLNARYALEKLAERIEYMELGMEDGYEKLLVDCLRFPAQPIEGA